MKTIHRLLPVLALLILALGLVISPAASQDDMLSFGAEDCDYGGNLKSIEAADSHTVVITLCNPDALFDQVMASLVLGIHPSEIPRRDQRQRRSLD